MTGCHNIRTGYMGDILNQITDIHTEYYEYWVKESILNPDISVIIPAYNVENYIEDCITSLIKQTFKNFEIIIVDDGSKDKTAEIINIFAGFDKRIIFVKQENQGVSIARNNAIKIASGKYISFIDADDYVNETYLEKLYNSITKNKCDIAAASLIREHRLYSKSKIKYDEEIIYSNLEDKINVCKVPLYCYPCNKLYTSILVKTQLFKERVYFEDVLWLPEILKTSDKLVCVPECTYYYRVNSNSIVRSKPTKEKQRDLYNAKKYIIDFFEKNNLKLPENYKKITKKTIYFFNTVIIKIKEYQNSSIIYFFGIPIYRQKIK